MAKKFRPRFEAVGTETNFRRYMVIAFGALAVLALVGGLIWWGRSLWDSAEARNFSHQGADLVAQGHFDQAIPLLVSARQKAPKDADVLRNLARAFDSMNAFASQAVRTWQQLAESGQATLQDRMSLAAAMVKVSDLEGARHVLDSIPEPERHQTQCIEIEAAMLRKNGHDQEADKMLRALWDAKPEDPSSRMKLAQMDLVSPFEPLRGKSRQTLLEIAGKEKTLAAPALLSLVNSLEVTPALTSQVRTLLSAHPEIPSPARLSILGLCVQKTPEIARELAAEESRSFAGKKPEECPEYYEWLVKVGDVSRVLNDLSDSTTPPAGKTSVLGELHPAAAVMRSRTLFIAYANALLISSKWQDLAALLELPQAPVNGFDSEILRALSSRSLEKSPEVIDQHLVAALAAARGNHDLWEVARVVDACERLDRPRIALDACGTLSTDHSQRLETLKRMFRIHQQLRDAESMLHTAESIVDMNASLVMYADHVVYLKLITGNALESAVLELTGEPPQIQASATPLRRLARALSFSLCGNGAEAARNLDALDPKALPAGARAVAAGLLARHGRPSDAFSIAEKISPNYILPEENWFMQMALR